MNKLEVKHCRKPWDEIYIHVDGDVKPCCYSRGRLGNAKKDMSLREITEGVVTLELREFVSANRIHPICSGASCAYVRERTCSNEDYADATSWASRLRLPCIPLDTGLSASIVEGGRSGNPNCMFQIGLVLYKSKRFGEAIEWFEAASKLGSGWSHLMLGQVFYWGLGDQERAPARARSYFVMAADEGLGKAFTFLGRMSLEGYGGDAADYFRAAGQRGDPEGWYFLSELYRKGEIISLDLSEADRLLKVAANGGCIEARNKLGLDAPVQSTSS